MQPIYFFIWQRLLVLKNKIFEIDGKTYFLYGKVSTENGKFILEYQDEKDNQMKTIPDLRNYLKSTEDISQVGQTIFVEIEIFIRKTLLDYYEELVKKGDIKIPTNFTSFAETHKLNWINNAMLALAYQENTHYIVQEGMINPVDYNSTGIIQSSTNWSDGLHQFLQIKHGLKLTCESLTTNFLSNVKKLNLF